MTGPGSLEETILIDELSQILLVYGYLPLSHFASWLGPLLSTYVISNVLISLSYFSMPVALAYFAWRCPDFHYRWLLRLLAVFLVACGTTYLMDVIMLWRPVYGLNTLIREIAAVASVVTSIMLWPYIHRTIKLPNINRLRQANEELQREIAVRKGVEKDLNVARRAAESGLQKEHILMAAIVESSEDAIVGRTLDGIITSWNPSAQRIFGYSAQEIVGQSVLVLFPLGTYLQEWRTDRCLPNCIAYSR